MKKRIALVLALLLVLVCFVSCGSKAYDGEMSNESMNSSPESTGKPGDKVNDANDLSERKIIHRISMTMETREFDTLIGKLESAIAANGAYAENADQTASATRRRATYVVRVPVAKLDSFLEAISGIGTVTHSSRSSEDVTLTYVDIESRIKSLRTEETALLTMMDNAKSLSDLIQIRSRLTEVLYQLDSYESQLRKYDDLIDYSTVTLYVHEVERVTEVNESVWSRIGTKFMDNLYGIRDFFLSLFIWFVGSLPVLLLLGAVAAVVIVLVVRQNRKVRRRMENAKAKAEDRSGEDK